MLPQSMGRIRSLAARQHQALCLSQGTDSHQRVPPPGCHRRLAQGISRRLFCFCSGDLGLLVDFCAAGLLPSHDSGRPNSGCSLITGFQKRQPRWRATSSRQRSSDPSPHDADDIFFLPWPITCNQVSISTSLIQPRPQPVDLGAGHHSELSGPCWCSLGHR